MELVIDMVCSPEPATAPDQTPDSQRPHTLLESWPQLGLVNVCGGEQGYPRVMQLADLPVAALF